MYYAALTLLGLFAGSLSGLIGIGGGVVIVPALIFLFGYSQHEAQGTTLALLIPPIGLLAAVEYYRRGFVHVTPAIVIALGFLAGGLLGAKLAGRMSELVLQRVFGVALLALGIRMIFVR